MLTCNSLAFDPVLRRSKTMLVCIKCWRVLDGYYILLDPSIFLKALKALTTASSFPVDSLFGTEQNLIIAFGKVICFNFIEVLFKHLKLEEELSSLCSCIN